MSLELRVLDLGKKSYEDAWEIQKEHFDKIQLGEVSDTLMLVEHDPTITFGINDNWNVLHVPVESLKDKGIAFHRAKRGGGAAYLGPGQLIGYTVMNIEPYGGVLSFLRMLEDVMIKTAGDFEINIEKYDAHNPTTEKPYRATWYRNGRDYVLCTKGIGSRRSKEGMFTHHGFCLNVNKNDTYYDLIDPCGFPASEVIPISIGEIKGKEMNVELVKERVVANFMEVFGKNG